MAQKTPQLNSPITSNNFFNMSSKQYFSSFAKHENLGEYETEDYDSEPCTCSDCISQTYDKTLIILKPDAVERRVLSKIIKRIEATDLTIKEMQMVRLNKKILSKLYAEHNYAEFFDDLINFMSSGPSIVMILEGDDAAQKMRHLIGQKHPSDSPAGTIRGDLGGEYPRTLIHGSDPWSAKNEVELMMDIFS
jgi:nucleoside-diphosphate kinase